MIGTITQAITAGEFSPVRLPAGKSCSSYSVWTEDGTEYLITDPTDPSGTNAVKVTTGSDGFPVAITQQFGGDASGKIVCYVKGTSSTNLYGIITQE